MSDPRSLRSWCIKGNDESTQGSSVPLMYHDLSDPDPEHTIGTHQKTTTTTGQQQ